MGHEDAFPRPRLSARCRFSQRTFAGHGATGETRRFQTFLPSSANEEIRPKPDLAPEFCIRVNPLTDWAAISVRDS